MPYYIAWDTTHKERGKIEENYSDLRDYLNSNDFECYNFVDMITQETLRPYDILVLACPDFSKISIQAINEIENWVKYDGGGLLLLSHAGGDRGRNSNLNQISELFGIAFENDQVLDDRSNLGLENLPIIYNPVFNPPHPITNELDSICFRAGCSLTVVGGGAFAIATSNETSDPFSSPIICVAEPENGRVCSIGSYELFRDKIGGGFGYETHPYFAYNLFNWLVSDYRRELRANGTTEAPVAQSYDYQAQAATQYDTTTTSSGKRSVEIDYAIRISEKSELLELLKIFSNQINTIKTTIDNLIEKVFVSEDEMLQIRDVQYTQAPIDAQNYESGKQAPTDQSMEYVEPSAPEEPVLSALPEKPEQLRKAQEKLQKEKVEAYTEEENFVELAKIEEEQEEKEKEKPKEKTKSKSKSKSKSKEKKEPEVDDTEKLKDEKESLESKLKSVRELIIFTNKRLESGKLDEKAHEKQISKLEKDLKKTQDRIEKIDKQLKK